MLGPQPFCLVDFVSFKHPKPNLPYNNNNTEYKATRISTREQKKHTRVSSTREKHMTF
jgi:hypothetical protein